MTSQKLREIQLYRLDFPYDAHTDYANYTPLENYVLSHQKALQTAREHQSQKQYDEALKTISEDLATQLKKALQIK